MTHGSDREELAVVHLLREVTVEIRAAPMGREPVLVEYDPVGDDETIFGAKLGGLIQYGPDPHAFDGIAVTLVMRHLA